MPTSYDEGVLIGLLVGEGHFGGDGRQPQVTLRMHERHEPLFRWIERTFPGGRLYGPYEHSGRRYYQWMARGPYLRDVLLPLLERRMSPALDRYAFERFDTMRTRYRRQLRRGGEETGPEPHATPEPRPAPGPDRLARIFAQLREPGADAERTRGSGPTPEP